MTSLFKSNLNLISKAYRALYVSTTMSGTVVIVGVKGREHLNLALEHLSKAINELMEIE